MKCVMCNRQMKKPFLMVGGQNIGPVCAEKRGLIEKKSKKSAICKVAVRLANKNTHIDNKQLDIFEQGENSEI